MNLRTGSGQPAGGDDRTYLYLAAGLAIVMAAAGILALLVWRNAGETARTMAALGLPVPGAARPSAPAPAAPPAVPPVTPAAAAPSPVRQADTVWFLADGGSTGAVTTTYVLLNAGEAPVTGTATFILENGPSSSVPFVIRQQSRLSLLGPARGALSGRFEGSGVFYAGRVTTGSDPVAAGGALPSSTWYLPLVESRLGYDDVLSLANFDSVTANVRVVLLSEAGITQTLTYTVPAMGRISVSLTRALAPLSSVRPGTPRGAVVQSDRAVVAGQTVQVEGDGSYALGGAAALSKTWYLAEANTRSGFETVLAVLNPGAAPARVIVTYLPEGRPPVLKTYTVAPYAPLRLNVNSDVGDAALGIAVEADQPVAAARVTYLNGGQGAHATLAAPQPARDWFLPDCSAVSPAIPFLVILNPGTVLADVTVTFFAEEGRPAELKLAVPPASRLALNFGRDLPPIAMGARLRSTQPIVVEQVTYFRGSAGAMAVTGEGR